jgi:hypothetical protein
MRDIVYKRNIASLVGGIAIAIGVFVLWVLCAGGGEEAGRHRQRRRAAAVGAYVRLADL